MRSLHLHRRYLSHGLRAVVCRYQRIELLNQLIVLIYSAIRFAEISYVNIVVMLVLITVPVVSPAHAIVVGCVGSIVIVVNRGLQLIELSLIALKDRLRLAVVINNRGSVIEVAREIAIEVR